MERRPLVGLEEAAREIGITAQTLWRWSKANLHAIPAYGAGRSVRFDIEELRMWLRLVRHFDRARLDERIGGEEGEAA